MKYRKTIIIGLILTTIFLVICPKKGEAFFFDLYDLSTDKVEYYGYETIEIHSNWTYYYSEDEVGFVQIQVFNESGTILWASPEYPNRSIYTEININVSLNDLNYTFNKPQDFLDVKLYIFNDDGDRIISTYQETLRVKIFTSGVYNFSMYLDKEAYQYHETCYLNSSWYLLHNSIHETANLSFQLQDENQTIKWVSNFFNFIGADSCLIAINLSLLDLGLSKSYNNFSMIAIYNNYNNHSNENNTIILTQIYFPIFGKNDFKVDLYDLSADKIQYYGYETLKIYANWTYYYSKDEIGFVQIQMLNESGVFLWISQEYPNRSTYMEINLNVSLSDLNYTFDKPLDFLNVRLYIFNDDGERIVSTYQESFQVKIFTSGVYNFSLQLNEELYQYHETCILNSSWYLLHNLIHETANLSFQLRDEHQNIKWSSEIFYFNGADSCLLSINLSLLDLGSNSSYNNFSIIAIYKNYNKLSNNSSTTVLTQIFFPIFSKNDYNLDIYDLSTNKAEYYAYETIRIHSNWTYYYSEDEVGFVQIQVLNETGMILWASQEYPNRSSYMEFNFNVSLSDLNYMFDKPLDCLNVKLYFFNDDGVHMVSTYQGSSQITIFTSGVYNFSMQIDKDTYQYYDTCILSASWYLMYNSIYETANISFQLLDGNQNIKWSSDFFYFFGADSCYLSINLSLLDLGLNPSYNNFSLIALYSNYNKLSDEISIKKLTPIFFPIFSKNDFKIDLYDLSTNKVEYYSYETIEIYANWTYYYSEDEVGFVQIQMINKSGMILWASQLYLNRSTYMELNLNVCLSDLSYILAIPEDIIEIRVFIFNNDGFFISSLDNVSEIINLRIYTSGVYNFSIHLNNDLFQNNDTCYLNSSWYLLYNPSFESANISFQLFDKDQSLKWKSNFSSLFGINSIWISINFSHLDLDLNRVINNFTLRAYFVHYNKLIPENDSNVIYEIDIQIVVDMLRNTSLSLSNSSYYFTSVLDISTSWELEYLPENQNLFIQIIIIDEKDNLIWASQRFNDTGLQLYNWQLSIFELPLNFTKDSVVLEVCFNVYWQDLITFETVSENILKQIIQVVKSNLNWIIGFEDNNTELIQMQIQVCERETRKSIKYGDIILKIYYDSSLVFQSTYNTDQDGLIIIIFHKDKELFSGVNHIVLEIQSELYNNTICIYDYNIDENPPIGSSSPLKSIITNPLFYSIISGITILSIIILFKIKKKKLASLTISEELLEN